MGDKESQLSLNLLLHISGKLELDGDRDRNPDTPTPGAQVVSLQLRKTSGLFVLDGSKATTY